MSLFDAFSAAPGQKAAADQVAALNAGKGDITQYYGQGADALNRNYAAALQPYTANFNNAQLGTTALGNALGLNGATGNAAATAAFQNNPGYQFQLQQGLNAANAKAAATGMGASGNNLIDLNNYAQGQANQGWNQYISNLQPYLGAANNAASGIAGVDTGLGNQLSSLYQGEGGNLAGLDTAIGKAQAGGDMAGYNASANLIGAGLGLAGDLAKFTGGGGGKALFGGFGA